MVRFKLASMASCLALAVSGSGVWAQDAGTEQEQAGTQDTSYGVNTIIVTAQKRAENVQDVPIAISAFSSESIQERAISDVSALSNIAPNVTLDASTPFSGSGSVLAAFIRGIGSNDFAFNLDPGVGVYLDGVYLARTIGANQDLLDVERIEILKGPQGTLFGRNTIGGAISIVTRDPGSEFAGRGDVTIGSFDRFQVRGAVDLPLSSELRSSVAFAMIKRDGYVDRVPFPSASPGTDNFQSFRHVGYDTAEKEGGDDAWNGRAKLLWDNGGRFRVLLTGDYTNIDQPATPNALLAAVPNVPGPFAGMAQNNIPGTALDVVTGSSGFLFAGLYNFCIGATAQEIAARNAQNLCGARGTSLNPGIILPPLASVNVDDNPFNDRLPYDDRFITGDRDKSYSTAQNFSKIKNWGLAGTIDFDLTDDVALKSITAYRDLSFAAGTDLDASPLNMLHITLSTEQWQFSQELQLLGSMLDGGLNYVLGAYYFKESGSMHDLVTFAEGLLQIDGPNELKTENYAAFGQFDWRINELLGITVGGRYTRENKSFIGGQQDLNAFNYKLFNCLPVGEPCRSILHFPDPENPLRYFPPGLNELKFENFSPKVGVQLHPTEDVMLYGSFSQGYKTGGFTTRLSNPLDFAPTFEEEEATTWEVGVKSTLFDRMLQLNAAAFTTKYEGIQLNFQLGVSPTIQNAGTATIKGFEVEAIAAPIENFTISANVGYIDAKYTEVLAPAQVQPNPFQAGVFEGGDLPKTPEWQFNISPRYAAPLANGGELVLVADYTHTSSLWNDTERTFLLRRPSVDMLNASVTYEAPSRNWQLTVGGSNLLDESYLVTGQAQIAGGLIYGTYNRPTEWYARLGFEF